MAAPRLPAADQHWPRKPYENETDRAEAFASYGKQAHDEALINHAMRIKARASGGVGSCCRR